MRARTLCLAAVLWSCGGVDDAPGWIADDGLPPPIAADAPSPQSCAYGSGGGSGSGYGGGCGVAEVECALDPCVHGSCIDAASTEDYCACAAGYGGRFCERCAEGFVPEGLRCVASAACAEHPCVFGSCEPSADGFVCACAAGYAGTVCDRCADGYHPEGIQCVAD